MRSVLVVLVFACLASSAHADSAVAAAAPAGDRDHDGIGDADDLCPDEPEDLDGWEDSDGCPDPDCDDCGPLGNRFVPFRPGESKIDPLAAPALVRLGADLRAHLGYKVIEISGQRSASEPPELASARAAAVRLFLIERYVNKRRLRVTVAKQPGLPRVHFQVLVPRPTPGG